MTEPTLAVVSPVFTVEGDVGRELARDCVRLEVAEGIDGLRTLQAHFLATGAGALGAQDQLLHLSGGQVELGHRLTVAIGSPAEQRFVFDGRISAIELVLGDGDPPVVVVLAEDALMGLRMTRRMRTYSSVSDADLARRLADLNQLKSQVDAPGPTYDLVQQLNQSDLAFLRERARLIQAELWCTGRTLHFASRTARAGNELTLVRGSDLLSARLVADLAHQRSSVVVTGYDADARDGIEEQAGPDVVEAEVTGGRSGPRLVQRAFGTTTSYRVRAAALTSEEARAWSRAEMLRRGRRFVTATGVTTGTPELTVGSRLTLQLVGAPFAGAGWYTTHVRHTFDLKQGMRTRFEAERSTLNEVA